MTENGKILVALTLYINFGQNQEENRKKVKNI